MNARAEAIINELEMDAHPEGGFYKEVHRSSVRVLSQAVGGDRSAVTDIYFLLPQGVVSRFHRVFHEEIWHFYEGSPLLIHTIGAIDSHYGRFKLGASDGCLSYKKIILASEWQAAEAPEGYALVGCTVAPGFEFEDFQMLRDMDYDRDRILTRHPDLTPLI
ncbi:MAG: putative cupin superfamily sugar epimerase [Candidatus Marinamargulisbacteria bacterium]|jgi:predicted cupin superfamily sugar epimerase